MKLDFTLWAVLLFLIVVVIGCDCQKYIVKETYWPGDPAYIVVEFPEGTCVEDCLTTTVDNRLLIVSPITEQMLDARLNDKEATIVFPGND